jgi:putative RecB family exonuclease
MAPTSPEPMSRQLSFEAMPRRLFSCTPSRLASFDCPRRYWMTYLQRPTPPRGAPWAHNTLGAVTHLALHKWWLLDRPLRTPEAGALLVERNWQQDGFRDADQSLSWRARAGEWVRRYLVGVDPDADPLGVERTVAVTTRRLAVSGRVDRIDSEGDGLVVVDYKTGRNPPGPDDARGSQALAIYALAAARTLRRACLRVELHHLPSATVASFEHTEASLGRHIQRAEETAEDVIAATDTLAAGAAPDEVFPPRPGPGCSWCDFRRHCPEGQAVSSERAAWDALAEATGH